jgi:hypothetical protein
MDREVTRETAANRARTSLMRKGLRQAKKEKNYEKALSFSNALDTEGMSAGMTGSAEDVASIATGRVASREALSNQMRSQIPNVMGQTREARIATAKADGSFAAKRDQFNTANAGKKVMDEAGNITDAPMPPAGGGTDAAGTKPAAGGETTPGSTAQPAKPEVKVIQSPRQTLSNAMKAGRVKVDDTDEANRLLELSSPGAEEETPEQKKLREAKDKKLAAAKSTAATLSRNRRIT